MPERRLEDALKLTNYALIMSGIDMNPNNKNTVVQKFINHYLFYCNLSILYTVVFGETYWILDGIQTRKPFVEVSLISPCLTVSVLGTIKSLYLHLNKGILIRVVQKLKEIHPTFNDNESFEESVIVQRKIMTESNKLLNLVKVLLLVMAIVVFTVFSFTPVLLSGYSYYKTGDFVVAYPYAVKYPFDIYESSLWQMIYLHQIWATLIVSLNVFGCDTLFYALCVYVKMHFELLGLRFEKVVAASKYETQRNLAKAVVRHQELIELVNQTEILYSKSSLFNIITSSVLMCLSGFNITVAHELSIIFAFAIFLVMSLAQIALICYFGDLLMKSSIEITGAVYNCAWYEVDEQAKRSILLVIMRSQKACRLTAWKFADLNLRAFTTILSRSWSYFALLKTVYK